MSQNALPSLGDAVLISMENRRVLATLTRATQSIIGGADGTASMIQSGSVTGDNIQANTITANEIDVNDLQANLLIAGEIVTSTDPLSARIEIVGGSSGGIFFYGTDGVTQVIALNTATGSALFAGTVNTSSAITAGGGIQFSGTSNVQAGASMIFGSSSGVADPVSAPTVSANWTTRAWSDTLNDRWGGFYDASGFGSQPTILAFTTLGTGSVYSATRVLREYDLATLTQQRSLDLGSGVYGQGAVRSGNYIYYLSLPNAPVGGASDTWGLGVLNQSDLTAVSGAASLTSWGAPSDSLNALFPGMFIDGAGFMYLIGLNGTGNSRVRLYQFDITTRPTVPAYMSTILLDSGFLVSPTIAEMSSGAALKTGGGLGQVGVDAGVLYISVFEEDTSHSKRDGIYGFDLTSGARLSANDFGAAGTGDRSYGSSSVGDGAVDLMFYDGSNLWSSVYGGKLGQHSNEYWSSDSALVFSYTFYDGSHESKMSPTLTMTGSYGSLPARSNAHVVGPNWPTGVNKTRFYVGDTSVRTHQWFQADGSTHTYATLSTFTGSGTNPPSATTFPASSPAVLVLPVTTTLLRPGSPTKGEIEFNSDTGTAEVYDGSTYLGLAPNTVSQVLSIPNTAGATSGTLTVSITGLRTGDVVIWAGVDAGSAFTFNTDPVCTVGGQITLRYHNVDDATNHALATQTHTFLVFRIG